MADREEPAGAKLVRELVGVLANKVEPFGRGNPFADQPSVRLVLLMGSWKRSRPYFATETEWESWIRGSAFDLVTYCAQAAEARAKRRCAYALASAIGGFIPQDLVMRIWAEAFWR